MLLAGEVLDVDTVVPHPVAGAEAGTFLAKALIKDGFLSLTCTESVFEMTVEVLGTTTCCCCCCCCWDFA
jgi:hypothetical protein